jgi:hypothetical protein
LFSESSVTLSSKKAPAILVAPELSAEEQQQADFAHEPWPVGTRVFSLWGHEYYPAIIAIEGRDGVGRYKVIFTEDGQNRDVPANGLIPLSSLAVGNKVILTKSFSQSL